MVCNAYQGSSFPQFCFNHFTCAGLNTIVNFSAATEFLFLQDEGERAVATLTPLKLIKVRLISKDLNFGYLEGLKGINKEASRG